MQLLVHEVYKILRDFNQILPMFVKYLIIIAPSFYNSQPFIRIFRFF